MRGNTIATVIIGTVIIISVGVFGVRTFTIGETFQSAQQAYTESAIMLEESLQQSIYHLMQRGYNNTAEYDGGELWWCNAATPPDLDEINRSLTILANESLTSLLETLEQAGVSASEPVIIFDFEDDIASLTDDTVTFNITEFIVSIEDDESSQSRDLARTYTYPFRTWETLKGLDAWIRTDAGHLSQELERVLNHGKNCLYDSCCCFESGPGPSRDALINPNRADPGQIEAAVQRTIDRLNDEMGAGITCSASHTLSTQYEVRQHTVQGVCQTAWASTCAVKPVGNPTSLLTASGPYASLCSDRREPPITTDPATVISTDQRSLVPSSTGSGGSDVVYNRYAVDKQMSGEIEIRCTDEQATVFIDGDFKPLEAIIRLGVAIYSECDIDRDLGINEHDYRASQCTVEGGSSGGGAECVECTHLCGSGPEGMCNADGQIWTGICGPDGEWTGDCAYRSCEELECVAPVECCDGEVLQREISCINDRCQPVESTDETCEEHYRNTYPEDELDENGIPLICIPEPEPPEPEPPAPNGNGGNGGTGGNGDTGDGPGTTDPAPDPDPDPDPAPAPPPCSEEGGFDPSGCTVPPGYYHQCYGTVTCNEETESCVFPTEAKEGESCMRGSQFCGNNVCRSGACVNEDKQPDGTECPSNEAVTTPTVGTCRKAVYECSNGVCQGRAITDPDGTCSQNSVGCDCTCVNGNPEYSGSCTDSFCGQEGPGTCETSGECNIESFIAGRVCCPPDNPPICASGQICCDNLFCATQADCGSDPIGQH